MTLILIDENVVDAVKQAVKIQIAIGNEGLKRLNASTLSDADKQDPGKLYQLDIRLIFRIHRMELMTFRQTERESTDEFANRTRHKGSLCDFDERELVERIIELIIASTPHELLQKHLLDQDNGYDMKCFARGTQVRGHSRRKSVPANLIYIPHVHQRGEASKCM